MNPADDPEPAPSPPPIEVRHLSCSFGPKRALVDVNLEVPRGGVFGLVGENGAGKTTLIRHVLGLYRPADGTVRVFGEDPAARPVAVLRRIGYLSEHRDLPGWMRVDELIRYSGAFYDTWDAAYAEQLRRQLDLDPAQKVKNLSQGQQAKAGLLVALAFRPELLVLDEPSSGLDPLVRRDILETILRAAGEEGRSVFFSSHLLDEVERVADRVAMIHQGRIVLCDAREALRHHHSRWQLRFAESRTQPPQADGVLQASGSGREWQLVCTGPVDALSEAFHRAGAEIVERRAATLDEIFLARAGRREA